MLKVVSSEKHGTPIPGAGLFSTTSQASNKSPRDMLNSIKEQPSGNSMSYKALYQNTLHLLQDSMQCGISIEDVKEVVKLILRDTMSDIHDLLSWEEGWNGMTLVPPTVMP